MNLALNCAILKKTDEVENIYEMSEAQKKEKGITALPGSLNEALYLMKKSELVKKALGEHIFSEFLSSKEKEWDNYRIRVTDWELRHYMKF